MRECTFLVLLPRVFYALMTFKAIVNDIVVEYVPRTGWFTLMEKVMVR